MDAETEETPGESETEEGPPTRPGRSLDDLRLQPLLVVDSEYPLRLLLM